MIKSHKELIIGVEKVANKSLMMQLSSQSAQQAMMQLELKTVKQKLDQVSRTLAQKDQLIGSLELDLEHLIDQLMKIQHNKAQAAEQQWIVRAAPGVSSEPNMHAVA
jgi:chromosome segregation ATPase